MRITGLSSSRAMWLMASGVLAISIAACGGGGGSKVAPAGPAPTAEPTGTGTLSFSLKGGAGVQSVAIALKGQSTALATVSVAAAGTATASVSAPAGLQTFVVTAFDGPNATGKLLSTVSVPETVAASSSRAVPLALSGAVASVAVVLGATSIQVGTAAQVAVNVEAFDANNNQIVGPGTFSTPVTLTGVDVNAATSLSGSQPTTPLITQATTPGTTISLNYNGNSFMQATVTPSIGSTQGTPATLIGSGSTFVNYPLPPPTDEIGGLVTGPDKKLWFTAFGGPPPSSSPGPEVGVIGAVSQTGGVSAFNTSGPLAYIDALATVGGTLFFGDTISDLGTIGPNGGVTFAPTLANGSVISMVAGPDGFAWFTDNAGFVGSINPVTLAVNEYSITTLDGVPRPATPNGIAVSGGKLWVTDDEYPYVDEVSVSNGVATAATAISITCGSDVIAADVNGNLWDGDQCENLNQILVANGTAGVTYNVGLRFAQLISSTGGIFGTNNSGDGNVYQITGLTNTANPPVITQIAAFPNSDNAQVLAVGPDGNIWTATDNTSGQTPVLPPSLSRVIYGGPPPGGTLAISRRISKTASHVRVGSPRGRGIAGKVRK
jgi:hypothetical protein